MMGKLELGIGNLGLGPSPDYYRDQDDRGWEDEKTGSQKE